MEIRFDGRRVLVTGATQGIGRGIARAFRAAGAEVHAADRDRPDDPDADLTWHGMDVTDPASVTRVVEAIGAVDVLVHSAGGVCGQTGHPVEEITPEDWRAIQAVNLEGAFLCARAVVPAMKRAAWGRIVTIASRAGLQVSLTGIQSYAAAKAGQIGLVRQLGHELGAFGITVNAVAPGFVRSNPATERQWAAMGAEGQERLVAGIAMRRLGMPDDIAHAVLFLASDQAGWITGQVLSVDGGR